MIKARARPPRTTGLMGDVLKILKIFLFLTTRPPIYRLPPTLYLSIKDGPSSSRYSCMCLFSLADPKYIPTFGRSCFNTYGAEQKCDSTRPKWTLKRSQKLSRVMSILPRFWCCCCLVRPEWRTFAWKRERFNFYHCQLTMMAAECDRECDQTEWCFLGMDQPGWSN